MPTSIIWTALPAGVGSDNKLKLSVYLAPRLTGATQQTSLAEFPLFQDWPAQVARIQQQIQVRYGATAIKPSAYSPLPSSEHWKDLFKPATLVKSFGWDAYKKQLDAMAAKRVRSYDVKEVSDTIREKYGKIAVENPINPPTAAKLVNPENLGFIGF